MVKNPSSVKRILNLQKKTQLLSRYSHWSHIGRILQNRTDFNNPIIPWPNLYLQCYLTRFSHIKNTYTLFNTLCILQPNPNAREMLYKHIYLIHTHNTYLKHRIRSRINLYRVFTLNPTTNQSFSFDSHMEKWSHTFTTQEQMTLFIRWCKIAVLWVGLKWDLAMYIWWWYDTVLMHIMY